MPSVWVLSFDWDAFETLLAPPATRLAQRVVRRLGKRWKPLSYFPPVPSDESEFVAHVAGLFAAKDWYAGRSWSETQLLDFLLGLVFHSPYPAEMKVKPLNYEGGVGQDFLMLATGRGVVVTERGRRRRGEFVVRPTGRVRSDLPELLALGCRPHRHPGWDREATGRRMRESGYSFLDPDGERVYWPAYSIHSPGQVADLLAELSGVRNVFRDIPDELMEHVQEELFRPVMAAAQRQRAIYARYDY